MGGVVFVIWVFKLCQKSSFSVLQSEWSDWWSHTSVRRSKWSRLRQLPFVLPLPSIVTYTSSQTHTWLHSHTQTLGRCTPNLGVGWRDGDWRMGVPRGNNLLMWQVCVICREWRKGDEFWPQILSHWKITEQKKQFLFVCDSCQVGQLLTFSEGTHSAKPQAHEFHPRKSPWELITDFLTVGGLKGFWFGSSALAGGCHCWAPCVLWQWHKVHGWGKLVFQIGAQGATPSFSQLNELPAEVKPNRAHLPFPFLSSLQGGIMERWTS